MATVTASRPAVDEGRTPVLSVIVPSVNGPADLIDCLTALDREGASVPLEVVVVDRVGRSVRDAVRQRYPWARVIDAPRGTPIPDLRAIGFEAARADVVGVIEDHVHVPPGWARQMLEAHARGEMVVGGAVLNAATKRLVDWAAFLCEYSHLLPPLAAGPVTTLTGNNTTYRRALLERFRDVITSGRWEDHLHAVLRTHGISLHCHPEIAVLHRKHYSVAEYASQRFLYARSYAAFRLAGRTWSYRVAYGFATSVLPSILLARICRRVWARPPYRRWLLQSLPLLVVFVHAWACGEAAGAWFGPGDAASRVC